jgi:hypothetical protein
MDHGYDGCVARGGRVRRGRRGDAQEKNTCKDTRFDKQTHDLDDDSVCGRQPRPFLQNLLTASSVLIPLSPFATTRRRT